MRYVLGALVLIPTFIFLAAKSLLALIAGIVWMALVCCYAVLLGAVAFLIAGLVYTGLHLSLRSDRRTTPKPIRKL